MYCSLSRISYAKSLLCNAKNPVTLCKNDRMTELIVWNNYNRIIHLGARQTLAGICSCYWILRGKSLFKKVLHRYMT